MEDDSSGTEKLNENVCCRFLNCPLKVRTEEITATDIIE